ncbi:MAG: transcription antitermination factor NusB [Tenericutes bacterium]|nr:transcription antitermination factor NusB [Mycoplasmatota bacterium]
MDNKRSELRYKIMAILYQISLYEKNKITYDISSVIDEQMKTENDFINEIVAGVISKKEEIDRLINDKLVNWSLDRLGLTDQAILRMAVYEILYTDTPNVVCIDEAVELSKKYSDEKVSKMINGVLDKIYHEHK